MGTWLATLPDIAISLINNNHGDDLFYFQQRVFILGILLLLPQAKAPVLMSVRILTENTQKAGEGSCGEVTDEWPSNCG